MLFGQTLYGNITCVLVQKLFGQQEGMIYQVRPHVRQSAIRRVIRDTEVKARAPARRHKKVCLGSDQMWEARCTPRDHMAR